MEGNISPYHHEMSWGGNSQGSRWQQQNNIRPVVPGGAGGAMAPPDFGRPINPISAKGSRLFPPNNTGTPGFSDLPTALNLQEQQLQIRQLSSSRKISSKLVISKQICFGW